VRSHPAHRASARSRSAAPRRPTRLPAKARLRSAPA